MARPPTVVGQKNYHLKHLWEKHRHMARMGVCGKTNVEIAEKLGMSQSRVSVIMNSPAFKSHRDNLSERADTVALDVKKKIEEGSLAGVEFLVEVLKQDPKSKSRINPAIPIQHQMKAACTLLDRAGHGEIKLTRNENLNANTTLTRQDIEALKEKRAKLLGT